MTTPPGAVRYLVEPEQAGLRQPIAVVAFGGWVDAATAGTGAVRHLVNSMKATKLAEIDPDDFYSFTDTRPLTSVIGPGERDVRFPQGEFFGATLPEPAESDLLLFVAPEPNLRWRGFANAMIDVMERFGVRTVVSVGAVFGAVHHRGNVPLTGWATEVGLRETLVRLGIGFASYEGPTGFVSVLLAEARTRNLPGVAIMAFTPSYVQGVPNPHASLALLKAVTRVTDVPMPLEELEESSRALMRQIDRLLGDQPDLREQVNRMLNLVSATDVPAPESEPSEQDRPNEASQESAELPNPQAMVRELEEFLKQLREKDQGGTGSNPAE